MRARGPAAPLWAAALLLLAAPGCAPESVLEARFLDCASPSGCAGDPALEGDDPASFCDDHNPCTTDANCTPCSAVPPAERDMYHCTADEKLPAFCAGHEGCVHVETTTPEGQANACFPVAGDPDLHAGVCRAGRCAEDGE